MWQLCLQRALLPVPASIRVISKRSSTVTITIIQKFLYSVQISMRLYIIADCVLNGDCRRRANVSPNKASLGAGGESRERRSARFEVLRGGVADKVQTIHFAGKVFIWSYDVGSWIKVIFGTGGGRDEPGQSRTLLTVLILNEASDLSIVHLSIILVNDRHHITELIVQSLMK